MSGMINIPSCNTDPNYRYRMPRLVSKVEGRGNGIKTNIMNMADIARALRRPPDYPTKFCGTELGAQSKFDASEGKSIVNGAHEPRDLQLLIDKFVEKYVLCPNCQLPEIDLTLKKGIVGCHCNACGHNAELDNRHKLATFMLKNPPKGIETSTVKGRKIEKDRKEKKKKSKGGDVTSTYSGDGDEEQHEAATGGASADKSTPKKKKDKKKKESSKEKEKGVTTSSTNGCTANGKRRGVLGCAESEDRLVSSPTEGFNDSDGDELDSVEEKQQQQQASKKKGKKKKGSSAAAECVLLKESLTYDSPEMQDVRERLIDFIAEHNANNKTSSGGGDSNSCVVTADVFFTELRVLQVSQDYDSVLRLYVALDVLLSRFRTTHATFNSTERLDISVEFIEEVMPFLRRVIDASMTTAKVCVAVEDFLRDRCKPEATDVFPFILHKLYLNELVNEDDLILRYSAASQSDTGGDNNKLEKKSAKQSKTAAAGQTFPQYHPPTAETVQSVQPFVNWLLEDASEASEDVDDDEEERNEDNAIDFTVSANYSVGQLIVSPAASVNAATADVKKCDGTQQSEMTEKDSDDDLDIDDI